MNDSAKPQERKQARPAPLLAAKQLTRVEVDQDSSNQHEFHAGRVRRLLGFGNERTSGPLTLTIHMKDGANPAIDETFYTLYDAREKTAGRSEWRLFYKSRMIGELAQPGDLLLLYRAGPDASGLLGVIVAQGTQLEHDLRAALAIGDTQAVRRFIGVAPVGPLLEPSRQLALPLLAPSPASLEQLVAKHPLMARSVADRRLPTTKEMATAAHEMLPEATRPGANPDEYIHQALELESALFFSIERAVGQRDIDEIISDGGDFDAILTYALSRHQSRKARRGYSLQHHMEAVLKAYRIPYTAQCETENGAIPDFIIPSCREYGDPTFPASRLRMIGCKSKLRERWSQYAKEALRVETKYHFTVDPALSDDLLSKMAAAGLRLFMPRPVLERQYAHRRTAMLIGTIEDLVNELRAATIGWSQP